MLSIQPAVPNAVATEEAEQLLRAVESEGGSGHQADEPESESGLVLHGVTLFVVTGIGS